MIYLDNSATTLIKPPQVAQAVYDAINTMGNSGRGAYNSSIVHQWFYMKPEN